MDDSATIQPTHFRWRVFILACGTSWLLYLHRYIFGLIKPKLAQEWGLGKDELGLIDSAFAMFYTGCQIPLGLLTDFAGVHFMLTAMIIVWSIGLALHAGSPSPKWLWGARATLGIGQSAVFAAQSRITRTWFPSAVRTSVQGWVGIFFGRFGGLSANLIVGSLMLGVFAMSWRTTVYVMATIGVVHALFFALWFRNNPRQHPQVNDAEADIIADVSSGSKDKKPAKIGFGQMFSQMSVRSIANLFALNIQTMLSTLADNIYSAWIPLFLFEVHGLKFKEMGIYSALPLLGGALGGASGGWLNDRLIAWTGNRRWSRSAIGFAGKGLAGLVLLSALLLYDSPRLFCVMLFFAKFFSDWSLTTTWGAVTDVGGRMSATVFAFNNTIAGVGSIAGPIMYGTIAEHWGWTSVFITGAAAYLACASVWPLINCTIPVIPEETS